MLTWNVINEHSVKHYIVVTPIIPVADYIQPQIQVNIVRTHCNGGVPIKITKSYSSTIGFEEAIRKINVVCSLDDELFNLVAKHSNE